MFVINKLRADHVIDFAAEELKKYLRMMMPRCGEIAIAYDPEAKDGFRLGLLEDFGIPSEAKDPRLDDVVHVDTDENGGILAGSNMRSILFAVYRFFKLNGCRWLYPGIDGEYIPMKAIAPQKYHKMADHRFRGHCNEGAESQTCMMETIEFFPKQELNVYMIEFDIPFFYYNSYYSHRYNAENRPPEPVSKDQVLQWKRLCEVEIAKRGLMFHDMGHGWTAEPFGLDSSEGWSAREVVLTPEQTEAVAELNGERKLYKGVALNTNLCMSNPKVRTRMAQSIAAYAEAASNVDYLHVWLADSTRNHCECEECRKLPPSDYYMMIMNELDEMLTAKGLETRITFIAYVDTMFAPIQEKIRNSTRFSLLFAPIHRSYCSSFSPDAPLPEPLSYVRNAWETPSDMAAAVALLRTWQKMWDGPVFSYEYHFWKHQYSDPSGLYIAKRVFEDVRSLKYIGIDGYVEDGSQRSFFPNGFAMYTYAEALLDNNITFEQITGDYFSHIYGEDWKAVHDALSKLVNLFDFAALEGESSADRARGKFYNPEFAATMLGVYPIAKELEEIATAHLAMPTRPQTVSYRLLLRLAEYVVGLAEVTGALYKGDRDGAEKKYEEFRRNFGRYEFEIERYFDHRMAFRFCGRRISLTPSLQEGT